MHDLTPLASSPLASNPVSEFRRGWPVVLACFCVATFAWGFGFYGQAVYLAELQRLHGWPAGLISSATTAYYLAGAVLLAVTPRAIDRFGPRLVMLGGTLLLGVGSIALSRVGAVWQLYAAGIVMAAGWACTSSTAIATTLAHWFDTRRGLAISLALNGASTGGLVISPLLVALSHGYGLAWAVGVMVIGAAIVVIPAIVFGVRGEPHPMSAGSIRPLGDHRRAVTRQSELLTDQRFWTIALPFALALAAQVGFIVHQVAFLLPHLGSGDTGVVVACTAGAATAGRLLLSTVIDRLNQRRASAMSFASQAAGLALMLAFPDLPLTLYIGSIVFGLSVGNVVTLPSLIVQREFAAASFGLVIGLASMIGQATLAMGPMLLGVVHDATGGYAASIALCIALQLAASAIVLIGSASAR